MDFINKILAGFLDGLKVKSPKTWAILAIIFAAIFAVVTTGVDLGLIKIIPGSTLAVAVQVLTFISGLLLQSRTTSFLDDKK